ncbi:MAG: hypothetical protein ACI8ZM_005388 [Crocinitomix sp.]|jgi:hypothetical protein
MKIWILLLIGLTIQPIKGVSQGVVVNFDLDTNSWNIGEPMKLWLEFLATKDDSAGAAYWNEAELAKYGNKRYFGLKRELNFGQPNYLEFISYANIRVLSIRERGKYFKISNMLSFTNEVGTEDVYFMFHVYAGIENGGLKLFNALEINTQFLAHQKVGFINYYYPKTHLFDIQKAEQQNKFLVNLAENFNVPTAEVDYYFTETNEEIQKIKGFDFIFGDNGANMPTGISYIMERQVFSNGSGEYYPHEIIHVLLNPHFPKSHYWINEGVATYFGMSRGKKLDWHLEKLQTHLAQYPEVDLSEMLKLIRIDGTTGYSYVLGGYIVKSIFEDGGYTMLKEVMNEGRAEVDFYRVIKKYMGVKQKDINAVFREQISQLQF